MRIVGHLNGSHKAKIFRYVTFSSLAGLYMELILLHVEHSAALS